MSSSSLMALLSSSLFFLSVLKLYKTIKLLIHQARPFSPFSFWMALGVGRVWLVGKGRKLLIFSLTILGPDIHIKCRAHSVNLLQMEPLQSLVYFLQSQFKSSICKTQSCWEKMPLCMHIMCNKTKRIISTSLELCGRSSWKSVPSSSDCKWKLIVYYS